MKDMTEGIPRRRVEVDPVEVYQALLLEIWADGVVTAKETAALAALRGKLGIADAEHAHLEAQVVDRLFPEGLPTQGKV